MEELIKITECDGVQTVSGRELHRTLGIETDYSHWFPRMCEYGFVENEDYQTFLSDRSDGLPGKPRTDHIIKLDMAKEICMIQRTPIGRQIRQYFIQAEKRLRDLQAPDSYMIDDPIKRANRWIEEQQAHQAEVRALESQVAVKEQQIVQMQPKAEFFDAVTDSKTAIPIGDVAKILNMGIGRNKLFEFLRNQHILMHNNHPYQKFIDAGYFRVIEQKYEVNGEVRISIKTLVFQKGVDLIRKKLLQEVYGK